MANVLRWHLSEFHILSACNLSDCKKFTKYAKDRLGWLPIPVVSYDCFVYQKCLKVVTILVANVLAWQLFCDNFPGEFIL